MSGWSYAKDFYSQVESLADRLNEDSLEDLSEELEEYGVEEIPPEGSPSNPPSTADYLEASFGLSYMLAQQYFERDEPNNTVPDEFEKFLNDRTTYPDGLKTVHLTQHVNLYSRIIQEEDLKVEFIGQSDLFRKNNEEVSFDLLDGLRAINEELSAGSGNPDQSEKSVS